MADYQRVAEKMTNKAFEKAGSLAETITFTRRTDAGFDMEAGSITDPVEVSKTAKAFITKRERKDSTTIRTLILQAVSFPDIDSNFTAVFSDGTTWSIDPEIERGPTLVTIRVMREGNGKV